MERSTLKNMKFGKEKLKNIWFFYKKQIIAGGLALVVAVVMLVQCAAKEKKDVLVYWAGPVFFSQDAQKKICDAFDAVIDDQTAQKIGLVTTTFGDALKPGMTDEERQQYAIDYVGEKETLDDFKTRMRLPDTVICILSRECFELALEDRDTLRRLDTLDGVDRSLIGDDGYGVLLSSLDFYKSNSIFRNFPEDARLCLKAPSILRGNDDDERQVKAFLMILSFRLKD